MTTNNELKQIDELKNDSKQNNIYTNKQKFDEAKKENLKIVDNFEDNEEFVKEIDELSNENLKIVENSEDSKEVVKEIDDLNMENLKEIKTLEKNGVQSNKSAQARSVSIEEEKEEEQIEEVTPCDHELVQRCLIEKLPKELIQYLNDNCDYSTTSDVFAKCFSESPEIYSDLCKEGLALDNPVAHHKYALMLAFSNDESEADERKFKVARNHLEKAASQGFSLSCFLLARLLHEHFKEDERAVQSAREGAERGDKFSQCILGHFIARGIGTKKNRQEGVRLMLESGIEDYCKLAATDIGLYFLELSKEEDQNKENSAKAFEWFEEAYKMKKTSASVNNYALCFLNGIFVERDIEKAKAIFTEGAEKGDPVSMYHLAHILETSDTVQSIEYYKRAAQLGHEESQACYSSMIKNQKY